MASTQSSPDIRERMEATVQAFMAAYDEGSARNDAAIINHNVTPDCVRYLAPASVPAALGLPPDSFFDTTIYQEAFAKDIKVLKFRNSIVSNVVIDAKARRAAFTSISDIVIINSGESYPVEGAWFLYFNEDGSKAVKVIEFVDKDSILRMAKDAASATT